MVKINMVIYKGTSKNLFQKLTPKKLGVDFYSDFAPDINVATKKY